MSDSQLTELLAAISGAIASQQGGYAILAGLALVTYDIILTFADEVNYMWTSSFTIPAALYYIGRYWGWFNMAFLVAVRVSPSPSEELCRAWIWYFAITGSIFFVGLLDALLVIRLYAVYGRARWVVVTFVPLLIVVTVAEMWAVVWTTKDVSILPRPEDIPFSGCLALQTGGSSARRWLQLVTFLPTLGLISTFFILTMYKLRQSIQNNQLWHSIIRDGVEKPTALSIFVRDGALYFVVIFCTLTAAMFSNVVFQAGEPGEVTEFWTLFVYTISASRLMLNMRKTINHSVEGVVNMEMRNLGEEVMTPRLEFEGIEVSFQTQRFWDAYGGKSDETDLKRDSGYAELANKTV